MESENIVQDYYKQNMSQAYTLNSKPTAIYASPKGIYLALADKTVSTFNPEEGSFIHKSQIIHNERINCIKQKDNLVITASSDCTVKLWDLKMPSPIAIFQKIPGQFNCVDKSGHILAAAYSSKIVFWDLRTGKQRTEFTSSFYGQITAIQFDQNIQTILMGCSSDGMINKFDLKQQNQQQAFLWCTKIMQSPSKLQFIDDITLIQTTNHLLYLLQDEGAIKQKIQVNNIQVPKHVVHSKLIKESKQKYYVEHFDWNIQNNFLQFVSNQKVFGYVNDVYDIEVFCPLKNNRVFIVDEKGNLFVKQIQENLSKKQSTSKNLNNFHMDEKIKQKSHRQQKVFKHNREKSQHKIKNNFGNQHNNKHSYSIQKNNNGNDHTHTSFHKGFNNNFKFNEHKNKNTYNNKMETQEKNIVNIDKNGYILQKESTSSLKNKNKKFKPY